MSEPSHAQEPPAIRTGPINIGMVTLVSLGVLALVIGAIAGFSGSDAAKKAETANSYMVALGGAIFKGSPEIDAGYAWMWFGIVLAVIGVLMLIAALVVYAARSPRG